MSYPGESIIKGGFLIFFTFFLWVSCASAIDVDWSKPTLIGRPPLPEIPTLLKKSNQMGMVILKTEINANGIVKGNEIIKSTTSEHVEKFLVEWVRDWQFFPRLDNGEVKGGFTVITIRFDFSRDTVEAPPPLTDPVQIPNAVAQALATSNVPEAARNADDTLNLTNKSSDMKSSEL